MLRVRMYRQGLGDCFLVSLPKKDGNRFYIMVDCGIVVGSPNPGIMQDVVKSIIEDTGGYVDVLVVTHEHYDHVSGFTIAQELFADKRTRDKLAVGEVWFAWTEDPNNALGKRLRGEREKRRNKLAAFVDAMQEKAKRDDGMKSLVEGVDSLLGFFGVAKGKLEQGTGPAMKFAAELAKVRYCRPTDKPTGFSDVPNVRLYVLGPPPEEKLLRKTDSKTEVYHLAGLGAAHSFFMTFAEPDEQALLERYQPFEPHNRCSLQELENSITDPAKQSDLERKFFLDHYFGPLPDADSPDQSWRRIDNAYMDAAAEFALQLDSATNNTSLVLAF